MATSKIYCAKCRDNFGHLIAKKDESPEVFREVEVVEGEVKGRYTCHCRRCRHLWASRSPEAAALWRASLATREV